VLETSRPRLITIEDRASIGIRALVIGHYREVEGVVIEQGASVGPGAIVLPGVRVGRGAVVTAGSVVTRSVPPMTVVQGNPAVPVARVDGLPEHDVTLREFAKHLRPLR
jgi:acetyltransferase-like isoleucine patch superfamily enzyme